MNDVNDALRAFLAPLASVLDACDPHWAVFGSAALSLCGFDVEVHDVDILTTEDGLAAFRRRFAGCCTCSKVPASTLFRSSMSRFSMDGRQLEVCAGLEVCRQGRWLPVEVQEVTVTDGIRHCSIVLRYLYKQLRAILFIYRFTLPSAQCLCQPVR